MGVGVLNLEIMTQIAFLLALISQKCFSRYMILGNLNLSTLFKIGVLNVVFKFCFLIMWVRIRPGKDKIVI